MHETKTVFIDCYLVKVSVPQKFCMYYAYDYLLIIYVYYTQCSYRMSHKLSCCYHTSCC